MNPHDLRTKHAMNLLERMQESSGQKVSPGGSVQNIVLETPDFRRIRDLERRDWSTKHVDELQALTDCFKTPNGTQTLRPAQAALLCELYDLGGGFAPIRVGGGKTIPSFLAAEAIGAKRALLLVPAQLIEKTRQDAYKLSKDWRLRPITIESYEMLSRDRTGRILQGLDPDLIIADEAHRLKNTRAGCTKKVSRFIRAKRKANAEQPWPHGISFVAMSGTVTTRSLREYWHLIRWALGPNAPLPSDIDEFQQWCFALDEKVNVESRWQPGALVRLSPDPQGKDELERARNAYRDRLVSTPGVISTKEEVPPMSLTLKGTALDAPANVREAITNMRATYRTPDEHPFEMPMELWRHCVEMQQGFYYVWDPRPPQDWLQARRAWSEFIRDKLKRSHKYDTPGHLVQGIIDGDVEDGGLRAAWLAVKPTFTPNTVPVWVDDTTLRYAADWLSSGASDHKLCWVSHRAVGPKLSELTGVPYFGEEGCDLLGNLIDNHKGPAIVSVRSCSTGRNLQHRFYQNLYLSPMSKNDAWEQSLGRTHRDGQQEDEVTAEVVLMCREAYSSLVYAIREAEYTAHTTGQPQKLMYCTRDLGSIENAIGRRDDEMWKQELEGA